MSYPKPLKYILENVVNAMTFNVTVYKVSSSLPPTSYLNKPATGLNYVLNVNNVYHAQVGYLVTIGGHQYEIVAYDTYAGPKYMTITVNDPTGLNPPVTGIFSLSTPLFVHGTPRDTNTELIKIQDASVKYPLIFLLEEYKEDYHGSKREAKQRDSYVTLCFLTQSDPTQQQNDISDLYVEPMARLAYNFVQAMNKQVGVFKTLPLDYSLVRKNKFAIAFKANDGNPKIMFADTAGVAFTSTLEIFKSALTVDEQF